MARRSRGKGERKPRNPKPPSPIAMQLETALDALATALDTRDEEQFGPAILTAKELIAQEPNALISRFVARRETMAGIEMALLVDATQDRAPVYLRRLVKARKVSDPVRFEAQRILGFEPTREDQHRRGFLASLEDAEGTLAEICYAVGATWPDRLFLGEEVLKFMLVMKPEQQVRTLHRIIERARGLAIPVLHGCLHLDEEAVALGAISALSDFRFAGSRGPLERAARVSEHESVRAAAAAALQATTFDRHQVESPDDESPPFPPREIAPPDRCVISGVMASGEQTVSFIRQVGDMDQEVYSGAGFVTDDVNGIADSFVFPVDTMEAIDEEIDDLTGMEIMRLDVGAPVIRGAISMAIDALERAGLPLAPPFELLEPLIHDAYPPQPDEQVVEPVLDDAPYAGRADLVNQSESLFDSDWFIEWSLDPISVLLIAHERHFGEPDTWTEEQYKQLIEAMSAPELIQMLRLRLRQQAYLLALSDEDILRDITLAVSASLGSATHEALLTHPFLMQMAELAGAMLSFSLRMGAMDPGDDERTSPEMLRAMADMEGIDLDELGITDEDLDLDNLAQVEIDLDDLGLDDDEEDE
jgi:hypothetical protein